MRTADHYVCEEGAGAVHEERVSHKTVAVKAAGLCAVKKVAWTDCLEFLGSFEDTVYSQHFYSTKVEASTT